MSKKVCFKIFIFALIGVMTSFVIKFNPVTSVVSSIFFEMQGLYLSIISVISALLIKKNRHYWLTLFGIALIVAIGLEFFVGSGNIISLAIIYKILAIVAYAFLSRLILFMW
jgi:hypothetical protein